MKQITLVFLLSFIFNVNSFAQFPPPPGITPVYFCDDLVFDGIYTFDLDYIVTEYYVLPSNFELSIHLTGEDAFNNVNPLSGNYVNSTNPEALYVRIYNTDTSMLETIGQLELNVVDCLGDTDGDTVLSGTEDLDSDLDLGDHDTDMNGTPNFMDDDDDGDGVLTINEDYNNNGDPTDDDINNNGIPDYLDVDATLGVETTETFGVLLNPNPASDVLSLQFNKPVAGNIRLKFYNIEGKLVKYFEKQVDDRSLHINVSELSNGLYFLKVESGNFSTVKKLIVN